LTAEVILRELEALAAPRNIEGMARFGIRAKRVLGVPVPTLRAMAKRMGRNHKLAQQLWSAGILESRILASLIDEPSRVTRRQMESWVADLECWADCDAVCGNLFDKTSFAVEKAVEWSARSEEFVKRAGFSLMAAMAVHDKAAPDDRFLAFLPIIQREYGDTRNFVKKAVNWALRQIGKRNSRLYPAAIETAKNIRALGTPGARWIASDALRELDRLASKVSAKKG
jgi:3-methyladenine DNA glycosylase AlkD